MKLASYRIDGRAAFGAVVGDGVVTMNGRLRGSPASLREALAAGALEDMRALAAAGRIDHTLAQIRFLPAVPDPDKILCVGVNYRSHAAEVGRELPPQPSVFARLTNTLLGHESEMIRPAVSVQFDFEGELAVVIGRPARHVAPQQALGCVAGYTCFVDGSVRDFQKHSVTAGKNFPATGPLGPWITTVDEIPDPSRLELTTRLNGSVVQHSTTDQMIYDVPKIISYLSDITPLQPGDVIATGTPEGVGHGRKPPLWMKAGDALEVEISRIGTLRTRIVDEQETSR
ncbi:MAG TPA: fumarylacetoacetate hydrolase family protein [Alphaproteobacteria bacterium]|nr:fumarylacetoacetate hydrolase family protein [Alphaproteobacteria bacterium]